MTFTEQQNIELPIINTLQKFGWEYEITSKIEEQREFDHSKIFVESILFESLLRLNANKGLTSEDAKTIVKQLKRIDDNEEFHKWLKGDKSYKQSPDKHAISIDFIDINDIKNNSFIVTNQYTCEITRPEDNHKHIRPDIVLLVNGIPITVIECKFLGTEGSTYQEGIKQLNRYQRTCPHLFYPNAFNISTDGHKLKYGATGAPEEYYFEWKYDCGTPPEIKDDSEFKKYAEENKTTYNPFIDDQLYALLNPANFIDLITNFIVFETSENTTIKKIARYQQFRAVNKIVDRVVEGTMKSGLIWHTQGSGKSLTMLFTAWKLRKLEKLRNPTVLIVVDRVDLDDQISGTFQAVKMPNTTRATSIDDLRKKLEQDRREVIITTVFKFQDMADILVDRSNVILLIDEGHRSSEGLNAAEMRRSLPNACFFGFTGTPIDKADKNTHRLFGTRRDGKIERYIDLYSIKQAIQDGATVPVYYQYRNSKWHLNADNIDELIDLEYDSLEEEKLSVLKEKAASYGATFMMNPERLRSIAEDIASHFIDHLQPSGYKAQLVAFNREACVILKDHLDELIGKQYSDIVFSSGLNDSTALRKYHKTKDEVKATAKVFKNKDTDLKILIVQSMLLTGFDAPVEQVMYLDRPLKDHTLLQAIARTNRPYPNKKCGIILDYCGVLKKLSQALNFNEEEIEDALIDYDQLKEQLPKLIKEFFAVFKDCESKNPNGIIDFIIRNDKGEEFKDTYRQLQITFDTLSPDPFVLDYADDYTNATKLYILYNQLTRQEKPDVSEYLPHTRAIIQQHIDLSEIDQHAPIFVVDDNYLSRLDGTKLNQKEKEVLLEQRLRSVLRIKIGELPIYKTLQERLERIVEQKEAEEKDTFTLLRSLMTDVNKAQKEEHAMGWNKGQLSIYQLTEDLTPEEELRKKITTDIDEIVRKYTEDFKGWQEKKSSVRGKMMREIIIYLANNKEIQIISPDQFSVITNEILKYVEMYY